MQTATATLADAIEAVERVPISRLRVDWDRSGSFTDLSIKDLTSDIVRFNGRRELVTDLPSEAKLFGGAASASVTVTLAHKDPGGDSTKTSAWYYSPLNATSPLYSYDRTGAPALLELGFISTAGPEYLSQWVGTVRRLDVEAGGGTATLEIVDLAETMHGQITLPTIIADGDTGETGGSLNPGLNTTFLVDWVARRAGYNASPPKRTGVKVSATMHGSAYPESGTLIAARSSGNSRLNFAPSPASTGIAKWVQALATDGGSTEEITYTWPGLGEIAVNNGCTILYEGWHKFTSVGVTGQPLFILYRSTLGETAAPFVSLYLKAAGQLECLFNRGAPDASTNRVATGPSISPGTSAYHYIGLQITFSSTGAAVTFRYDNTTTGPINVATASVTGVLQFDRLGMHRGKIESFVFARMAGYAEAIQLTTEATTSTWNNAFVPTAQIVASPTVESRLVATPPVTEKSWRLLQQIAASEYATTGFSETGLFTYWPRSRWATPPYDTSQRTLTSSRSLKDLATQEAVDQVINKVAAVVATPVVSDMTTVWQLGQRLDIPANSSRTLWPDLPNPVGNVDTSFSYSVTPGAGSAGNSRYAAGTAADGSGSPVSNLQFVVTVLSPTSIKIVISNPNPFRVWLTPDANFSAANAGKPYVLLDGQFVDWNATTGANQRVEASDSASIATHEEQLYELPANDFRQDLDSTQNLVDDLLTDLAHPGPILKEVPIPGDPRLQLGDRVTVKDPEMLGAATADFHIAKVETTYDRASGLGQSLTSRGLIPGAPPAAPLAKLNSFEGGTDGTAITTGNSGGASGDPFDAVYVLSGVQSMTAWVWPVDQPDAYQGCYYRAPSPLPSATIYILQSTGAGNANGAQVRLTSAGAIQASNASDTTLGTSATTVAAGELFRVEMHHVANPAGGNGTIEVRIFAGADVDNPSDDPTEVLGPYSTAASTVVAEQRAGITFASGIGSGATAPTYRAVAPIRNVRSARAVVGTVALDYDNQRVSSTGWPGPTPAPPVQGDYDRVIAIAKATDQHYELTDPTLCPIGKVQLIVVHWNVAGITGRLEAIRDAHPNAMIAFYQDPMALIAGPHTNNRPTCSVTQEQAASHDAIAPTDSWRLHRESDNGIIVFDDFTYLQAAAIQRQSYRDIVTQHLVGMKNDFIAAGIPPGRRAIFVDDVNMFPGHGFNESNGGNAAVEFNTDNDYRDAVNGMMAVYTAAARAQGLYVVSNFGIDPWTIDHYDGYLAALNANSTDAPFREFWSYFGGASTVFTGNDWTATVQMQLDAEQRGHPFLANNYQLSPVNHPRSIVYGLASLWVNWNGGLASAYGYNDGKPVANIGDYRKLLGQPIGPKTLVSGTTSDGAWICYFQWGVVCINAKSAVGNVTFNLDGQYKDATNTLVSSVVLGSGQAAILLRP